MIPFWLTYIHLNFLAKEKRMNFYRKLIETSSDGVLISGDITLCGFSIEVFSPD